MKYMLIKVIGTLLLWSLLVIQGYAQTVDDHILGDRETTIVPDNYLREYDPITVFYKTKMGPRKGGIIQKPNPTLFSITPDHPGEYQWVDQRTLQFTPTIAWPALKKYKISVNARDYQLITLMKSPISVNPVSGSSQLDPIEYIFLTFADPIQAKNLAGMITFEIRDLPGLGDQEVSYLSERDFSVKTIERTSIKGNAGYQINFNKPISFGKSITLNIKLADDPALDKSAVQYRFSTKPLFRLATMGCENTYYPIASTGSVYSKDQTLHCGSGQAPIILHFSESLGPISLDQIKKLVKFKPAVRNLNFTKAGKRIYLRFEAQSGIPYHISLVPTPIFSHTHRKIAHFEQASMYFYYSKPMPFLRWSEKQGVVERYGPQKFPMEGRETAQVDLRIYKIDPLDRNFWPFADKPLKINENKRPAGPGEVPNPGNDMPEQIRQLGSPLVSKLVTLPIENRGGRLKFGLDLKEAFNTISGKNQPGTYLVGYREIGNSTTRHYVRIQVTDLSLTTVEEESGVVFIATSLKTGQPVKNVKIVVEARKHNSYDETWIPIISGTTDQNGMFLFEHIREIKDSIQRIVVRKDKDFLVLNPSKPPNQFVNNHWYPAYYGWLKWLNRDPMFKKNQATHKLFIFTERPIYRPNEEVHIKGYLRNRKQGKLITPHFKTLEFQILGPGDKTWMYTTHLSSFGSFYLKFKQDDLPTGSYRACLLNENVKSACVRFSMENYRVPKFEIQISGPDKVPLDRPFKLVLTAGYYAGGQVIDQPVSWRATQFPYWFSPPNYPGFIFSTNKRFYGGKEDFSSSGGLQDSGKTDINGSSIFNIDPSSELNAQPRQYIVEATVRGADEQTVTSTKRVAALPPYMVGLKLERLLKSGLTIRPELLVLDHNSKPVENIELNLRLMQRQWHSHLKKTDITTGEAKYLSEIVDVPILEKKLLSKNDIMPLDLEVKESGIYIIEVSLRDQLGRLQKVSSDLFVVGNSPVTWQKTKANVFRNTLDKRRYVPGEIANLVIKSPFQTGQALVIIEKPEENEYKWIPVVNGQGIVKIQIDENMVPQLPVHTVLMRGRVKSGKTSLLNQSNRAKPVSMAATTWIIVYPKNNRLKLNLTHPESAQPSSTMALSIDMTDPDGKPLDGEVTLWLVDKAVLALGKVKRLDPVPSFIDTTRSYLRIRDTRNEIIGDLFVSDNPGGDGSLEEANLFDRVTVRKNFKTVPYYQPRIMVKHGKAIVSIQLPDNLTDFAIRAVATDGKSRFGHTKSNISIRLPLIIQSALPRFVRPGDKFTAGGIGRVVAGKGGQGKYELQLEGLSTTNPNSDKLSWNQQTPHRLFFPMEVTADYDATKTDNSVTVSMAVVRNYDDAKDAFQAILPIKPDRSAIHETSFTKIIPGQPVELVQPEETPREGTYKNRIIITQKPALLKMLAGLDYLSRFPHGCTEQRISRVLPDMVLTDLHKKLGDKKWEKRTKRLVTETLKYLKTVKRPEGLYSYWPGSQGYVNLTAYVVEFLLVAKQQGYSFHPSLLDNAIQALTKALRSDYSRFISGHSFYERASALYALALADKLDEGYLTDILAMAFHQDLYSEANILFVMKQNMQREKDVEQLKKDLWANIIFRMRNSKEEYQGLRYRSSGWGGLINTDEIRTLGAVSRALYVSDPKNPKIKYLTNELISLGRGEGWGNTSANAAALMALGEIIKTSETTGKGHQIRITFSNDSTLNINTGKAVIQKHEFEKLTRGTIEHISGSDDQYPVIMTNLSYLPNKSGDQVQQKNNGFVIDREIFVVRGENQTPIKADIKPGAPLEFEMGTVLEEHIQVINPEERHFVAIRAPFAAGLDPINPNLATSSKLAKPEGKTTLEPSYALYADDQVTFYYDTLPKGTYHFYFRLRTTVEGSFSHPAAIVEMMYKQSVRGRSNGTRIIVKARAQE